MPRVLHVSAAGVYGGNEEHLRTLFAHLDRRKVETQLAAPEGSSLFRKASAQGIPCHPLSIRSGTDPVAAVSLARILKRSGARILHTHNRWEDGLGALLPGCRWVTTLHDRINMDQEGNRTSGSKTRLYRWILRRADLVLANSKATARDAVEEAGLDPARVLAITNGQDLSRLEGVRPDASRLPGGACRVGLFARVRGTAIQKKGVPEFIEAAAEVLRAGTDATFYLVGADEAAAEEADRLAYPGVMPQGSWVTLPFLSDPRPVMAATDVVVCPSRFEGLPRSLLEAMGLGRAVVGTAVDGISELIEDGVSGLLVPPRAPGALAAAIGKLAGDPGLRERLGKAAARRVRECYGADRMAREHEAVYLRLAGPAIIPAP